jgi:hypothetical protein
MKFPKTEVTVTPADRPSKCGTKWKLHCLQVEPTKILIMIYRSISWRPPNLGNENYYGKTCSSDIPRRPQCTGRQGLPGEQLQSPESRPYWSPFGTRNRRQVMSTEPCQELKIHQLWMMCQSQPKSCEEDWLLNLKLRRLNPTYNTNVQCRAVGLASNLQVNSRS